MPSRLLKVVAGIVAAAAAGGLVYHFRLWEKDWSTIDDGWASLIGSAMGSFLAVLGALYVSKAEERRKKKEFEDFVRETVQNLVLQASYLEAMAREPHKVAPTTEMQASIISIQQRTLTDALAVFDKEVSASKHGDYALRRGIVTLEAMLGEVRHGLSLETSPGHAIHNWHIAAYQVRHNASHFLDVLKWFVPIPTAKLIGDRTEETIRTWRSWNTPTQTSTASTPSTINSIGQPLHHAHA